MNLKMNTIYRRNIKLTGTKRHVLRRSTDYYQRLTLESWFTNLEQTYRLSKRQSLSTATVLLTTPENTRTYHNCITSVDGIMPSTDVIQLTLTLMTTAQTDVSTTCAVVIRVKVSCITSVDGIILWLLI